MGKQQVEARLREGYSLFLSEQLYRITGKAMAWSASRLHSTMDNSCVQSVSQDSGTIGQYDVRNASLDNVSAGRRLNFTEVEDCIQDTWETVCRDVAKYASWANTHTRGDMLPLLRAIAKGHARNSLKLARRKRETSLEQAISMEHNDTYLPGEFYQILVSHKRLVELARALLAGVPLHEYAKSAKIHKNTVTADLQKLKALLQEHMAEEQEPSPEKEIPQYKVVFPPSKKETPQYKVVFPQVDESKLRAWLRKREAKRQLVGLAEDIAIR